MATIPQLKNTLTVSVQEAKAALVGLDHSVENVDKAIALLNQLSTGAHQISVLSAIEKLKASREKFAEGCAAMKGMIERIEKYNARI